MTCNKILLIPPFFQISVSYSDNSELDTDCLSTCLLLLFILFLFSMLVLLFFLSSLFLLLFLLLLLPLLFCLFLGSEIFSILIWSSDFIITSSIELA